MKRLKTLGKTLLVCYLLISGIMFLLQEKLIFLPSTLPQDYTYNFSVPFNELFLESEDGASLNALHFKVKNPKGIIVYFHGNAGDLSRWGDVTSYFTEFGYDVLVMDYRTYGKSTGALNEKLLYEDAQLFYDKAKEWFPENKITVYGRSLGTTFAIKIASENKPKQLILEAPFYSLYYAAQKRYWMFPVKWLLKYQFKSNEYIQNVSCSITIFHGTEDRIVPYENGKKLHLLSENARLITIEQGAHNNLINFQKYSEKISQLLP